MATSMVHPVQSVVESLYAAGRCPRLHLNALFDGVVCPDFIKEQWRERLIIDLDASYPLDLSFEETGIAADLSFGGYVTRCSFPWGAVYVVADRSTGRGIVLDQNMPESVRRGRGTRQSNEPAPQNRTELRPVIPEASEKPAVGDDKSSAQRSAASNSAVKPAGKEEEAVKKRRATFRVIDGGG